MVKGVSHLSARPDGSGECFLRVLQAAQDQQEQVPPGKALADGVLWSVDFGKCQAWQYTVHILYKRLRKPWRNLVFLKLGHTEPVFLGLLTGDPV